MRDECLAFVPGPDGRYALKFRPGAGGGWAVISGPIDTRPETYEIHREAAANAADARRRLNARLASPGLGAMIRSAAVYRAR